MTGAAADAVGRVLSTVDYLRVTIGDDDEREWIPCSTLVSDSSALLELVRSTAADRGTDRDDVAMSLFVQGYAFRIASIAIGAWFLDGLVLDVSPHRTAIALGRARPNAVRLDEARAVDGEGFGSLATLHELVVEEHLVPFLANVRAATRIGEPLLWSNVGASCAAAFGALMGPLPERRLEIRDGFEAFLAAARPELRASGRVAHVGPLWAWERSACCLWYKTESAFKCEDCSLWTDAERRKRYDRVLAELEP